MYKYDLLMPKMANESDGFVLADGNFVRKSGDVPQPLEASRLHGGSIGIHAHGVGASRTLCGVHVESVTKDGATRHVAQTGKKSAKSTRAVALTVTCRSCLARLVSAGILAESDLAESAASDKAKAYALAYGAVSVPDALAGIAARAEQASKASARKSKSSKARA